jgi:hypothetical protein
MQEIHKKSISFSCSFHRLFYFILPDAGDIIAETVRTDRNFTCVLTLCEYVGVINETQIFVCLESDPSFLSEKKVFLAL